MVRKIFTINRKTGESANREAPASLKAWRSVKRTPWKVDVCNRIARVREDIEIAVRTRGWEITNEDGGSGGQIKLKAAGGTTATATQQIREAEAVVLATFGYIAKTEETLQQSWQWLWEWLTGGLLMSAYTSLHAAETNRIELLSRGQLAALLPIIRQRAVEYLPVNDPRLVALQGLPDPTAPAHQALARLQSNLVQAVATVHATVQAQEKASLTAPAEMQASGTSDTSSGVDHAAPSPTGPGQIPPRPGPGDADDGNGGLPDSPTPADTDPVTLTGMLGHDQRIAAMAMGEATRIEDEQQAQVRRFRGVLLGIFLVLFMVVGLLAILGGVHPGYFPLCLQRQVAKGAMTFCPTGGSRPSKADLAFLMAIGGIGAVLAVVTNLTGLKPTGVRYSLSVMQGLVKIPFGAITAMLGIIILSTQSNIGVLATHAGLLSTAAVFGYSQQLFTKFIDKRADYLLGRASGSG